ncbi:MAG: carboxy terminal-processing peptidase [Bacteroidales bacterium]|nr:carboxy terminal-processing peptidase [Bacteroidales bacterium]
MKKKLLIVAGIVLSASLLLSCFFNEDEKEQVVLGLTYNFVKSMHYEHIVFDDAFSQKVYDKYIENLDYSKKFLLSSDIKKFSKYELKLDDFIKQSDLSFFDLTYQTIVKRQEDAKQFYTEILDKPFDLNEIKEISLDVDNIPFAASKNDLYDYWQKSLKLEVLQDVDNELEDMNDKIAKGDTSVVIKTVEELEVEARLSIKENYDDYFDRLSKLRREDYFSLYINSIALSADPHSSYFPPKSKEDFDIQMSGELEGIGATLTQKFSETKVASVVVGGAAWKQGELEEGDIIVKVAQEGEEPVTITSMRLDDAVRLIRGPKGTNVYLTIKKIDGTIKEIQIVRDKIILEETFTRSVILNDSTGKRIAYINLPSFYIDFQNQNGRKCSQDFKNELIKLKKDNVDGIIIDLRNNGGGSLQEVIKIAGFFIKNGPIVQVKDRSGRIDQRNDDDASILYDGDVLIMTNHFSASASEIFAAAMQDYNRAVIFGTPQTLGKGTVQQMLDMDRAAPRVSPDLKPLGAFKLTIQKFYRINGGSTQLKGVASDISFVSTYTYLDMNEAAYDNVLPWDKIPALQYTLWQPDYNMDSLRAWSVKRMNADSAFIITKDYAEFLRDEDNDKLYVLTLAEYSKDKKIRKQKRQKFNRLTRKNIDLDVSFLSDDINTMQTDTLMKFRYDDWAKKINKDYQLKEAFNIVSDMNRF